MVGLRWVGEGGCASAEFVGLLYGVYSGNRRMLLSGGHLGASGVALSCEPNAQVRSLMVHVFFVLFPDGIWGIYMSCLGRDVRFYLFWR